MIEHVQKHFGLSQRKTCKFLAVARSTARYIGNKSKADSLLELMKTVVVKYPKAGYQMIYLVLRKTGLKINHNIYCFENLSETNQIIEN